MRVLFWMSVGFDRRTPSEHLLTAMIEALYQKGHTVHILQKDTTGPLPKLPEALQRLGVRTTCIKMPLPKKSNFIARYFSDVRYVMACRKFIRKKDAYDAVFLQSTNVAGFATGLLKNRLPGAPVTYNVQDIFPYNAVYSGNIAAKGIAFKVLAAIQRYAYKRADHVVTISEDMRDLLIEAGAPAEKVEYIYNWSYRDEPYTEAELDCAVARNMFPERCFNVVYAGNIGVMQNVDLLVKTAELMREETDIHFHIIGDGAYKDKLHKQAQEAGLTNLTFHPMQSSEMAPSIYMTADVNVIPLVKNVYRTALPSKTATCLACGKPIIFAIGKDSKFGQWIQEETGCLVTSSESAEELRQAIVKIKTGQVIAAKEVFSREFGLSKNAMRYAKILENA